MTVDQRSQAELLAVVADLEPGPAMQALRARSLDAGAIPALADAAEALVISDLKRALDVTGRLVALADAFGEDLPRARARRARAQALSYGNRFQEAIDALAEATALADRAGAAIEAARARLTTLHALARMGRYDEAIAAGQAAREAFVRADEPIMAARADINLGVTQRMRDRPREAIEHFERARPAVREEPMLLAALESNRAEALLDLNRFTEAEQAFESAREQFIRIRAGRAAGIVEGNLADLAGRQGRLDRALEHFERALAQLGETEAPGDVARLQAEQAEAFSALGMHAEAAESYRRAVPVLRERQMAWEAARAQAGLGRALLALARAEEARAELDAAAAAFEALGHATGLARTRMSQAVAAVAQARPEEAERLLTQAAALLHDRPAELALARLHLSTLALRAGRIDEAERSALAALDQARQLDLAPLVADLLHALARIHRARGRLPDAVAALREAIAEVERVRGMLGADRFRAAFLGGRLAVYEEAVAAVLDLAGPDATTEAFALAELAKSRSLLDLLQGGVQLAESAGPDERAAEPDAGEGRLLSEVARLRGELNAMYAQLDAPAARRAIDPAQWRRGVRDHESRLAGLEGRLAATRRYAAVFGQPVGLSEASARLAPGVGLIEFFGEPEVYSAIVATGRGAAVVRGLAPRAGVREHLESLYFQLGRAIARGLPSGPAGERLVAATEAETQALHRLLIAPLAEHLAGLSRLIIVPHGSLHAAPFHALSEGRGPLGEAVEVAYAPSASVLDQLVRKPAGEAAGRALVVGFSDETIPHAEREAQEVAARLPGAELLLGPRATMAAVTAAMRGASLIHLATHARFVRGNPLASGVKLADGWITAREIYGMRLEGAEVTLSGCDTARSVATAGEEHMGLTRAFLVAGARSLLMSLWPAHDESTAEFMLFLYGERYNGAARAPGLCGALRQAWMALRRRQRHPAAWAPFVLVGAT